MYPPDKKPSGHDSDQEVFDAEVIHRPGADGSRQDDASRQQWDRLRGCGQSQGCGQGAGQRFGQQFGMGGGRYIHFRQMSFVSRPQDGCLAPAITLGIFLGCCLQLGLLAGIGFAVFYGIGAVLGTMRQVRLAMQGQVTNPWIWRIGNWIISLMLVSGLVRGA